MRRPPPLSSLLSFPVTAGTGLIAAAATAASSFGRSVEPLTMNVRAFEDEPYRLLTSALPHGDVLHLAFNLYWLWIFGSLLEKEWGPIRAFATLCLFAAGSAAAEYALFRGGIGLSGVGYGLFSLLWILEKHDPRFADAVDARTAQLFAAWFVLCIVATAAGVWLVANVAHGVGALLGVLLGLAASKPLGAAKRTAATAGVVIVCAASTAGGSVLRPQVNLAKDGGLDSARIAYEAFQEGDVNEAVKRYREALAVNDENAADWFNLAIAYDRLEQEPEATEAFARAHALLPNEPLYKTTYFRRLQHKGYLAQREGQNEEAVRLYEECLRVVGDDATTFFNLAIAERALGRDEEATRHFDRAKALDPTLEK